MVKVCDVALLILPTVLVATPSAMVQGLLASLVTSVSSMPSLLVMMVRSSSSMAAMALLSPVRMRATVSRRVFFILVRVKLIISVVGIPEIGA